MTRYALMFVLLAACSTETSPIASNRDQTVPRQLFGHAGRGGSGIVALDGDGSVADGGRPRLPTGTGSRADGGAPDPAMADDGGVAADSGQPIPAPDGGSGGSTDAGSPDAGSSSGVGVCGHCSATEPCAQGLTCVDEAAANLSPAGLGQSLGKRCYIDCTDQAGKDACSAQSDWCGYGATGGAAPQQWLCPLQRSTYKTACRD